MAAILISVLKCYYGMPRAQIHINFAPEHPIMSFKTIEIKMATVSAKRTIGDTVQKSYQINSYQIVGTVFEKKGKPEYPGKYLLEQSTESTKTTHV